ncbi:uncharacterized protein LOC141910973 [Tubulanus polymorphus]|uniref:uncharacterized protein LOC141910973 n=1 Tax=Tubulanus polymorphus TaxID=672921 RepID=UPI003DA364F8
MATSDTSMAFNAMDVDVVGASTSAGSTTGGGASSGNGGVGGSLKRCNSAPMINIQLPCPTLTSTPQPRLTQDTSNLGRIRRFSTSSLALNNPQQPAQSTSSPNIKCPTRLHQIKSEETQDREVLHERQTQSAMLISNVCEDLHLDDAMVTDSGPHRQRSLSESLHVFTGSPTRLNNRKQCYSPLIHAAPVKQSALTPSPSPSPTRKSFTRRSLSPIALKPSSLSLKRKLDGDSDFCSFNMSPAKRFSSGPGTPDRLIVPHPLTHSISCSSLESGSPEQLVPAGGAAGVKSSLAQQQHQLPTSASSPTCYTFRPVAMADTSSSAMTDSENSDMNEQTTSMSDSSIQHMQFSPASVSHHT